MWGQVLRKLQRYSFHLLRLAYGENKASYIFYSWLIHCIFLSIRITKLKQTFTYAALSHFQYIFLWLALLLISIAIFNSFPTQDTESASRSGSVDGPKLPHNQMKSKQIILTSVSVHKTLIEKSLPLFFFFYYTIASLIQFLYLYTISFLFCVR